MAAGDLITPAQLQKWVGATATDTIYQTLVSAASKFFLTYVDRDIIKQDYTLEQYDGVYGVVMQVKQWPVNSVATLIVDGVTIAASPDAVQSGYLFNASGRIALIGYAFSEGFQNVRITYNAGYDSTTIPLDIQQAVCEVAGLWVKERDHIGQVSKTLGGQETVTFTQMDWTQSAKQIADQYRRKW